jgi:uncharacterized protein YbjT (DUF2867 family)
MCYNVDIRHPSLEVNMRIAVAGGTGMVGRHVVARAQKAGHEVVVLSRSRGVDVRSGEGLADALTDVETVIDVTNAGTTEQGPATEFFTDVAGALQRTGAERGVGHIVTLSIVGIDQTSFGYYAAKLEHERAATNGAVPSTVLRATQFHEFPAQVIAATRNDSQARVFDLRVQTVAARTVAEVLLELAEGAPIGRAPDLAGPQEADLVALARAFVEHRGEKITVHPDAERLTGIPPRALLPGNGARLQGPTFDEWLSSEDAAALKV